MRSIAELSELDELVDQLDVEITGVELPVDQQAPSLLLCSNGCGGGGWSWRWCW